MKQNDKLIKLSRRERQIMDIVFEYGEILATDIMHKLPEPPGYSAVRALLARLVKKEVLAFKQDGPRYLYYPVVDTEDARQKALSGVLKTFFNNSPTAAVTALLGLNKDQMSISELDEIAKMINKAKLAEAKNNK